MRSRDSAIGGRMQLFVKSVEGKTLSIYLPEGNHASVSTLKHAVHVREGIPVSAQKLFVGTKFLSDDSRTLEGYGILPGMNIFLLLPIMGGMQAPLHPRPKLDFLNMKPSANYVAGLGRGATGFTTRSDIGPARAALGVNRDAGGYGEGEEDVDDKGYDENQNFDEFEGNDRSLLTTANYDDEDKEADTIWEAIDRRMESRRKSVCVERLKKEIEGYRASNPTITEQFADLKRDLSSITVEEWDNIPETGNYRRNKKRRFESFIPVPDSLFDKAKQEIREHLTTLDPKSKAAGGAETPWSQMPFTDFTAFGQGREKMFSRNLDKLSDSVSGLTVVDPKDYLTDLKSVKIASDAEVSDIKKARLLLKSVTQTNPKHAPGWIAAARLEEVAGRLQAARKFIERGCKECPENEDVWLESSRLASPDQSKAILARGVKSIPNSVQLWMQAAKLEDDDIKKSRVLRKALERIPNSVRLWKAVIELASEDDAKVLLARATECCPLHMELWLALARLESYDRAKEVLNEARKKLPTEHSIWITGAKLEEANGNLKGVSTVIERATKYLQQNGVDIDREAWIKEAEAAERAGSVATCQAIIESTIGMGVDEEDRKRTWVADADECKERGSIETARAIYAHALSVFKGKKSVWLKAAQLEKSHGTRESLNGLLQTAVTYCPRAEVLWLMGAKENWLAGNLQVARDILREAFAAVPNSEKIWLAASKLEFENNEPMRAKVLLAKARQGGGTERVWMKSALVERELGNVEEEKQLLEEGINKFPNFFKLWLMFGQLEDRQGHPEAARKVYQRGLKSCPNNIPLWLGAAQLEEKVGGLIKARAVLTKARLKNPQNAELWLAAIRAECRGGNKKEADMLMARALQECPKSGQLWAEAIEMAPRHQQKSKMVDASIKCHNNPYVIASVAKLFWHDRKVDKARTWLERAVMLGPDVGDFWVLWFKFELHFGTEDQQQDVLKRCVVAEPRYGEHWISISKAVENAHLSTECILNKVVIALGKEKRVAGPA